MKRRTNIIPTTHTGSLPRPEGLLDLLRRKEEGHPFDAKELDVSVRRAVSEVVIRQADLGLDIINDGEQGKVDYSTYVKDRLTGFEGESVALPNPDAADFPEWAARFFPIVPFQRRPACTGPIAWKNWAEVQRDIDNLKVATADIRAKRIFMTAVSPGQIARFLPNQYFPTHEAYLYALAEVMKEEYKAITQAGFLLQLDCPDLAIGRSSQFGILSLEEYRKVVTLHIEVLNYAVTGIPPEQMRMHLCWGNYEGPHHRDVPLKDIIDIVLRARPAAVSFPASNPRHEHEWKVWNEVRLPEGKVVIPGVIDSTTNFIEHPELVAERLLRFAQVVGPEKVIAGTDCGFGTFAGRVTVDPRVVWHKLQSMVEGARLASIQLGRG